MLHTLFSKTYFFSYKDENIKTQILNQKAQIAGTANEEILKSELRRFENGFLISNNNKTIDAFLLFTTSPKKVSIIITLIYTNNQDLLSILFEKVVNFGLKFGINTFRITNFNNSNKLFYKSLGFFENMGNLFLTIESDSRCNSDEKLYIYEESDDSEDENEDKN